MPWQAAGYTWLRSMITWQNVTPSGWDLFTCSTVCRLIVLTRRNRTPRRDGKLIKQILLSERTMNSVSTTWEITWLFTRKTWYNASIITRLSMRSTPYWLTMPVPRWLFPVRFRRETFKCLMNTNPVWKSWCVCSANWSPGFSRRLKHYWPAVIGSKRNRELYCCWERIRDYLNISRWSSSWANRVTRLFWWKPRIFICRRITVVCRKLRMNFISWLMRNKTLSIWRIKGMIRLRLRVKIRISSSCRMWVLNWPRSIRWTWPRRRSWRKKIRWCKIMLPNQSVYTRWTSCWKHTRCSNWMLNTWWSTTRWRSWTSKRDVSWKDVVIPMVCTRLSRQRKTWK